jgi:predicted 2-oxoglutarate/Fe(II)-dependent dioxygenase YbiX
MSSRFDALPADLYEITRLIAGIESKGSFATCFTGRADNLHLTVDRAGRVSLPVLAATVRKLRNVAQMAHYGLKDQTLLDPAVRDTWEIPGSRISIEPGGWKPALARALERVRRDLGLALESRIDAQLHNLLVYAPGQFFKTHQDSEKAEGMIGTLVVALPSRFTGGEFVIEHHDETLRAQGSTSELTFIAFYADCRHEIRPITSGHRVVLTWNLIARNPAASDLPPAPADALARRVRAWFDTPKPPRWSGDLATEPPDRLVYLLDHEYTQRGLDWGRLKNADALRAAMLLEVARRLDCEIFLALADVHETWSCQDDYFDRGFRGRWRDRHYDDNNENGDDDDEGGDHFDDDGAGDYELIELIESDIELRHWVAPGGRKGEAISVPIDERELCYTKPSIDCEPFESEHEGYTGNAGNTVDHWYHRAAIVLWPRERDFVIRAKASARWAVDEISRTLGSNGREQALEQALGQVRRVLPFWPHAVWKCHRQDRSALLTATLQLAISLDSGELAATLLAPFRLVDLSPDAASHLAELLERRGIDVCRAVLDPWMVETKFDEPTDPMLEWLSAALPTLCRALRTRKARPDIAATRPSSTRSPLTKPSSTKPSSIEASSTQLSSEGEVIAGELLKNRWAWLCRHIEAMCRQTDAEWAATALSRLGEPLLAILDSCGIAQQLALRDTILALLTERADTIPLHLPLAVLRAARPDGAWRDRGLEPVQQHLVRELTALLARPERAEDDWSIHTPIRCTGALCETLTQFLRAPHQVRLEWPLAEQSRQQIHSIIDSHGLPVRHTTRRVGRPYTLMLEKSCALFEREAATRRFWAEKLAWLEGSLA